MPLSPQMAKLLHNKWAVGGLVGAAGVGGYVLYKRKSSGSGNTAAGTTDTTTGQATTGGVGTLDTSGTDIANWLGQYSGNLQNQLDQYQQQLTSAIGALQNHPTSGSSAPTTLPAVSPITMPGPTPVPGVLTPPKTTTPSPNKPTAKPAVVIVKPYTKTNTPWQSTLSGIASHYHTSVTQLLKLNPSIKNKNLIHPGQQIRVS